MIDLNKLNKIAIKDEKWLQEARNRQINKEWQKHSKKIASKVLVTLREKKMKQNQLADIIGVSAQQVNKIVKGKENLTLETIVKLENALSINLIFQEQRRNFVIREYVERTQYVYLHVYANKTEVAKQKKPYTVTPVNFNVCEPEKALNYGS